jgi:hypothetical protein
MSRSAPRDPNVVPPDSNSSGQRIVQTLIDLARVAKEDRVLVAGALTAELLSELHRRGCVRVATTACCGTPHGQSDVALIAWHRNSLEALAPTLDRLVHFLRPNSVLAVWVDRSQGTPDRKLKSMLHRLSFRIEAGTTCENGLAVAARRLELLPAAKAA